ncbi:MAG: hypothetical protein WKG06_17870 [Segetibacter sp.]
MIFQVLIMNGKNMLVGLRYIMADKYKVQAYDDEKNFRVFVDEIVLPKVSDFFYDISSIYGVLTSIGSRQLNTRSTIHIIGCKL